MCVCVMSSFKCMCRGSILIQGVCVCVCVMSSFKCMCRLKRKVKVFSLGKNGMVPIFNMNFVTMNLKRISYFIIFLS